MTPLQALQEKIDTAAIIKDERQIDIMKTLDVLYHELIEQQANSGSLFSKFKKQKTVKGLYLWGTVGTGKSFLMDLFFTNLPLENKMRIHFHAFMQRIHQELKEAVGQKEPLTIVAKKIARDTCVLCFDEFFVSDIADAMLLGGLFEALFAQGVTLITNSNCKPDDLYKNGMLRERFFPAIELIKENTRVIHILTKSDYRLRHMLEAGVYYTPLNEKSQEEMAHSFKHFSKSKPCTHTPIRILGRDINIIKQTDKTIWFDFKDICGKPRSQNDYIELAKCYQTVLISNVPIIGEREEDFITCFIKLVDVFYDERIRLVLSAQTLAKDIYPSGPLSFEFQRTESRLIEMQSKDYFDEALNDHLM
jgi:cell division protein ZapE